MPGRCCTECGRSFARANVRRVASGLPQLRSDAKTCGAPCSMKRQKRLMRERWTEIKHRKLVAERPVPEPWRCTECGIDAGTADIKRKSSPRPV